MIQVNLKTAFYEFEWVIRVMKSAETKHQLDVVYKCFHLWEQKHISKNITKIELNKINSLRSNFWAMFKNKNIKFDAANLI
jgi:hypothetical protein